jgi:hypothetical protein
MQWLLGTFLRYYLFYGIIYNLIFVLDSIEQH